MASPIFDLSSFIGETSALIVDGGGASNDSTFIITSRSMPAYNVNRFEKIIFEDDSNYVEWPCLRDCCTFSNLTDFLSSEEDIDANEPGSSDDLDDGNKSNRPSPTSSSAVSLADGGGGRDDSDKLFPDECHEYGTESVAPAMPTMRDFSTAMSDFLEAAKSFSDEAIDNATNSSGPLTHFSTAESTNGSGNQSNRSSLASFSAVSLAVVPEECHKYDTESVAPAMPTMRDFSTADFFETAKSFSDEAIANAINSSGPPTHFSTAESTNRIGSQSNRFSPTSSSAVSLADGSGGGRDDLEELFPDECRQYDTDSTASAAGTTHDFSTAMSDFFDTAKSFSDEALSDSSDPPTNFSTAKSSPKATSADKPTKWKGLAKIPLELHEFDDEHDTPKAPSAQSKLVGTASNGEGTTTNELVDGPVKPAVRYSRRLSVEQYRELHDFGDADRHADDSPVLPVKLNALIRSWCDLPAVAAPPTPRPTAAVGVVVAIDARSVYACFHGYDYELALPVEQHPLLKIGQWIRITFIDGENSKVDTVAVVETRYPSIPCYGGLLVSCPIKVPLVEEFGRTGRVSSAISNHVVDSDGRINMANYGCVVDAVLQYKYTPGAMYGHWIVVRVF